MCESSYQRTPSAAWVGFLLALLGKGVARFGLSTDLLGWLLDICYLHQGIGA